MSKKKPISENTFLSVIACPNFYTLNYDPYKLDISQTIALTALKYFYKNIDKLYQGLNIDNLINISVKKSIGSKLKNELDSYKKSIKLYSYTFIYDFIKKYPLEKWAPVLIDVKVPFENIKYLIHFNYDFILRNIDNKELSVINFFHKSDKQIESNLHYFECKASFVHDKVYNALGSPKIHYALFYLPRYKHSSLKKRDTFLFINLSLKPSRNIIDYVNLFNNKMLLNKNPFCLNYSCKVRKLCYGAE